MTEPNHKDYYKILGIAPSASLFEIENAYQKLATEWHPDRHKQDKAEATVKFNDMS